MACVPSPPIWGKDGGPKPWVVTAPAFFPTLKKLKPNWVNLVRSNSAMRTRSSTCGMCRGSTTSEFTVITGQLHRLVDGTIAADYTREMNPTFDGADLDVVARKRPGQGILKAPNV